jgi:hypothetical protein
MFFLGGIPPDKIGSRKAGSFLAVFCAVGLFLL